MRSVSAHEIIIENDVLPEYCSKSAVILGCGNILLGDDGFGPEVINQLQTNYPVSDDVALVDAGTGVVDIIFNIALSPVKPRRIILVDAMKKGQPGGALSMVPLEALEASKLETYSQHQVPTSKLLRELQELGGVQISILTVEPESIPEEIQPGLSLKVKGAVLKACDLITAALNKGAD